jgi:hypothetical protein
LVELERDELKLYHIICDASWKPGPQEKANREAVLKQPGISGEFSRAVRDEDGG